MSIQYFHILVSSLAYAYFPYIIHVWCKRVSDTPSGANDEEFILYMLLSRFFNSLTSFTIYFNLVWLGFQGTRNFHPNPGGEREVFSFINTKRLILYFTYFFSLFLIFFSSESWRLPYHFFRLNFFSHGERSLQCHS